MFFIFGIQYLKTHFTHHQRYIIVAVFSMFLPFYMCGGILIFLTLRLLWKGEIQEAYRQIPKSRFIIYFSLLSAIVSLFYQNYYGFVCSIGILVILSFVLYYRIHIDSRLFEYITNCIIVLSIFAALYGLIEYIGILNSYNIDQFEIMIFNRPQDRINSVFFNANYYAMMIEFFVCLTFYKILKIKDIKLEWKKFIYYVAVIGLNLFVLLLTACRTAWPALAGGILIMLIVDKHYKTCACILALVIVACIYFLLNPSKFPRVDNIVAYFMTRAGIWEVAIQNIITHPLFGEGPMTYMHIYPLYHGHPTEHAHSIYLDPLLCFGIVGLLTIAPYIYSNIQRLYRLWKLKVDKTLVALIVSFTVMIFIHGILDYTIFFVQTGFLYLLIASSFDVHKHALKAYESLRK
ncbi:O-antigen ligase family protein [Massilimicrobiota timonensis]|uniref:O-antigen ligase family protein n=1 Tax=Massilimicrobiota timonensis TaxID=1776392 RepID=A0ABT7UJF4_9FIRM|nr:O-antigen ligase family protein [Massilimicrobiota timonensis]MDM8196280.1 O-antigen ligase family protein [Massilimicrobiota timonensis]MEE0778239.1 O-antigen ligase family protein [Massilimicrobiota sp.]